MADNDESQLRVCDQERDRVAGLLRDAFGEGRLDAAELEERLEATYAARTVGDLARLTADLPPHDGHSQAQPTTQGDARRPDFGPPGRASTNSTAVMGDCKRKGQWTIGPIHTAVALMGDVVLDLREATFSAPETTIKATSVVGDVKIWIDEFTEVILDGVSVIGDFKQRPDKVEAELSRHAPCLRVEGTAVMGDVIVQRLPPPGTPRRLIGRY